MQWSPGLGISWKGYFSLFIFMNSRDMDRDRGLKKWYLHTVFQSEAFFYTVIEYLLCARWICSHDHTQCGSFCPHNFPESRILWLWGQRPLQTKLRPKRGAFGTPILGSAVRLLKGLEPGTRTLGRQGGGGSFSVSLPVGLPGPWDPFSTSALFSHWR